MQFAPFYSHRTVKTEFSTAHATKWLWLEKMIEQLKDDRYKLNEKHGAESEHSQPSHGDSIEALTDKLRKQLYENSLSR